MGRNSSRKANVFNPNNPAFKAAADLKSNITNPTSSDFKAVESNRAFQLAGSHLSGNAGLQGNANQPKP